MTIWKDFEIQCTNHLNNKFGKYATFYHQGGSNSTVPDILVETIKGKSFYIEAKHSPAQCGQFVLLPNVKTKTFEYSKLNVNPINKHAKIIMEYMNNNFNVFKEAGTAGKYIDIPNGIDIFSDWIIQTYKDKKAYYFITNNYTIFPIEQLKKYFNVTAKYRIKRSGSSNVGKRRFDSVMEYISTQDYVITDSLFMGDKLYVYSPQQLHEQRFTICEDEFMFSIREDKYELRKLSKTYNANVIFSIEQKENIPGLSEEEFINCLK